MAEGVEITFNLPDFKRQLEAFDAEFQRFSVRGATNAAAQVFKKHVIAAAPILRTKRVDRVAGTLRRAIYVVRTRKSGTGKEHYVVGFRKGKAAGKKGLDAFYGRFLEAGWIPRGPGRRIRGGKRLKALKRERLSAHRITKYGFILPGFQKAGADALQAFNKTMDDRIHKQIQKERASR